MFQGGWSVISKAADKMLTAGFKNIKVTGDLGKSRIGRRLEGKVRWGSTETINNSIKTFVVKRSREMNTV